MSQLVLQAYIESETQAILQDCTTCGKCVDVCPMLPYGNLQGADSTHVVSGILDILRGGQGHDEARRWAQVCTASGSCIPACPEGINPRKMLNLTKHTLKNRERLAAIAERYVLQAHGTIHPPPRRHTDDARAVSAAHRSLSDDEIARRCHLLSWLQCPAHPAHRV